MTPLRVGTNLPSRTVPSVSGEKMKTMAALLADPNRIHFDVDAVRDAGMGDRVINQGPTNLAYVMNMLISWCGEVSQIRSINARFLGTVYAGDSVTAGGEVKEITPTDSGSEALCDIWLDVDGGARVISGSARVLWPARD
jgi:acyl dehydratase